MDLQALLEEAREADPTERILYRDRIASYGEAAVPSMVDWLSIPGLGAFAVRVLARIGEAASSRDRVRRLLMAAEDNVPDPVRSDVRQAIERLGGGRERMRPSRDARPAPERWPGKRTASPLELKFHDAMLDIFSLAGEATRKVGSDGSVTRGYWASYFLRGVRNHGGLEYARRLLAVDGTTAGFQRLTDENRLDLTMEALVLRPEFAKLFSERERAVAASRLARAGYQRLQDRLGGA